MGHIFLEDFVDNIPEMELILYPKLQRKLQNNRIYKHFIENNISIIKKDGEGVVSNGDFSFFNFYVFVDEEQNWRIDLPNNLIHSFLKINKESCGIKWVLIDYIEVLEVIKEIFKENTSRKVNSEYVDQILKRCELMLELRGELNLSLGSRTYPISKWSRIELKVPNSNAVLIIPETDNKNLVYDPSGSITLPYEHQVANDKLIHYYLNDLKIFDLLKNRYLQQTFVITKEEIMQREIYSNFKFKLDGLFRNRNKKDAIEYASDFEGVNPKEDFFGIIHLSISVNPPVELLESAYEMKGKPGYTQAIKTEQGFYFLKNDGKTIAYQSLNDTYN